MTDDTIGTIAIVGAGLIGRSWAIVFARAGWQVNLTDASSEARDAAARLITQGLDVLVTAGLMQNVGAVRERVSIVSSVAEAVAGADIVQECIAEKLDAKREIFAQLDQLTARLAEVRASDHACLLSIGWGGGLLGKSAYLKTEDDSYRKILRQMPLLAACACASAG